MNVLLNQQSQNLLVEQVVYSKKDNCKEKASKGVTNIIMLPKFICLSFEQNISLRLPFLD